MDGWIKLHRQMCSWEWYDDANVFRLFIHLLLNANHEDIIWRGVEIKRGQKFTSVKHLSEELKLSEKAIRIAISKLKKTKEIDVLGASNGTMITICKYDTYQTLDEVKGQAVGQTRGERGATNKNEKNEKNENEINNMCIEVNATCFSFEDFWKDYPNKTAKAEAEKKYAKLSEEDKLAIKNSMQSFINYVQFPGYKHPMATTFINQKRWKDFEQKLEVVHDQKKPVNGTIDLADMLKNKYQ